MDREETDREERMERWNGQTEERRERKGRREGQEKGIRYGKEG